MPSTFSLPFFIFIFFPLPIYAHTTFRFKCNLHRDERRTAALLHYQSIELCNSIYRTTFNFSIIVCLNQSGDALTECATVNKTTHTHTHTHADFQTSNYEEMEWCRGKKKWNQKIKIMKWKTDFCFIQNWISDIISLILFRLCSFYDGIFNSCDHTAQFWIGPLPTRHC